MKNMSKYFNFILLIISISITSISHTKNIDTTPHKIQLTRLDSNKECRLSPSLKVVDNYAEFIKSERFEIGKHQKLRINLINRDKIICYTFEYEPTFSPIMFYKLKGNNLIITEMMGTFENGNQIENTYRIKHNPLSLVFIKDKQITYSY